MKSKYKIGISILCVLILIPIVVNARYFEKLENIKGMVTIAEPIFKVETLQDTIVEAINKESEVKEYVFKVKNYDLESDGISKRITEVDMKYNIEIINEKTNFPVKYELFEEGKEENLLKENKITDDFIINKNVEYEKTYKLIVSWENKEGILEDTGNIKIIINSSQIK